MTEIRSKPTEPPHLGSAHFCAGCPWAMLFHWGCEADSSVRRAPDHAAQSLKSKVKTTKSTK